MHGAPTSGSVLIKWPVRSFVFVRLHIDAPDLFGRSVHIPSGFAVGLVSAFQPLTTVTINNFYGPRRDFEEIVRELFLRFVIQFMGGGGDPDNGGGGGDDDDDGDGDGDGDVDGDGGDGGDDGGD